MSSFNNSAYEPLKTLFPIWPLFEKSSWLKFNISATLQQPPCHNEKSKPCTLLNEQQHWFGKQNRVEWLSGRIIPQKKISYRRESFIHLNQGLFYENLLWSSLWPGKVIASKFKIFVMKMSECARLSVAAMVCVNLVALSSKNWSQIKHLLFSSLLVSLIYCIIFVKITNCWVWSATKGHRAFKSDAWFITMAIDNQWPNNCQNKFGNLGTVSSKVTDQFEPYRWVKLESS